MSRRRRDPVRDQQPLDDAGADAPARTLGQDCLLYFRDIGIATLIFLPLWELLHLGRTVLFR